MTDAKTLNLVATIVDMFSRPMLLDDPTVPADERADGKATEIVFTESVEYLRSKFPDDVIRALGAAIWRSVESKRTPVGVTTLVRTLHFGAMGALGTPTKSKAFILAPPHWTVLAAADPVGQLGGVVYVGSQAVDYCHGRMYLEPAVVQDRAHAYEAQYLLAVRRATPSWSPNSAYQQKLLDRFPNGVRTPSVAPSMYEFKEDF